MIKLTLEVTPGTCNLLLASLAETQMQVGAVMQQIKAQGDAQMQPPQPEAEAQQEILDADE